MKSDVPERPEWSRTSGGDGCWISYRYGSA